MVTQVNKTGDSLSGPLLMGDYKITSSYIPVDDNDLTNKKYVDAIKTEIDSAVTSSNLNSKLDKTGGILSEPLDVGPNKIMSSYIPVDAIDLTNKAYVDNQIVPRLGDEDMRIITNNLALKVNKTDIKYVRNSVGHIPDLDKNESKSGYIVTASSEITISRFRPAYFAFCSWKPDWQVATKGNMWIKM